MNKKRSLILASAFIILLFIFFVSGKSDKIVLKRLCDEAYKYKINGQYEQAESKYLEAYKKSPKNSEIKAFLYDLYSSEFFKYMGTKDYQTAIIYGEKALPYTTSTSNYFDLGICYQQLGNSQKATEYFNKALELDPSDSRVKKMLEPKRVENPTNFSSMNQSQTYDSFAQAYQAKDYQNAVLYGEQYVASFPNNVSCLGALAYSYLELKDYSKSAIYYKRILSIDPNNEPAKTNLKYLNFNLNENNLNVKINNMSAKKAPQWLYVLIKTNNHPELKKEIENILDLVWSVPSGQRMLNVLWDYRVPINIIDADERADVHNSYLNGIAKVEKIDIPIKYINYILDKSQNSGMRIYGFTAFMHEFGHAFYRIKYPRTMDSLEEELGVDMIANNIAWKIIEKESLTRKQTKDTSMRVLEALLSDDHRDLQVYSGYQKMIRGYYLEPPFPEEYSDIVSMYKKLLSEGKTTKVPNIEKLCK